MRKPVKSVQVIKKIYWCCGHPKHHHKTEGKALECITSGHNVVRVARNKKAAAAASLHRKCSILLEYMTTNKSCREVGELFNLSGSSVNANIMKALRYLQCAFKHPNLYHDAFNLSDLREKDAELVINYANLVLHRV